MNRSLGARLRERACSWGGFIFTTDRTASTNDLALEYAGRGAPHGSLFLADEQTHGRGRWKRTWVSPSGGLYLSVLLRRSEYEIPSLGLIPIVASLAACEALERTAGLSPRLRWPNDLFVEGMKIGGILCESRFTGSRLDHAVVGVGLNVNQHPGSFADELRDRSTSVRIATRREWEPVEIAAAFVAALELRFRDQEPRRWRDGYRERADGFWGLRVRVEPNGGDSFLAVARDIADDGGLRVGLDDGSERVLYSEDVVLMRQDDPD